jgi:3-hydroxyacyl-CoA dehydrogenase/enoyl-CoA hydratase/3-hydroxybutyryl-CoA epimerase/3-hydroxyacyl-CoA dehydrogenase/enoyl-CoA hydratase/3-hydroxybutyryl-CoA epimerase/enoyl-CoA isomerase
MDHTPAPPSADKLARRHVDEIVRWNRALSQVGARPVRSAGILGAGLMGTAIAAAHVKAGIPVTLWDIDSNVLAAAPARIAAEVAMQAAPGTPAAEQVAGLVSLASGPPGLAACEVVVESVVEDLAAKRRLWAEIVPHLAPRALLASNTSTIPIGRLATGLACADRFCGIHFFHPVRKRSLVEIVRGPATSAATVAAAAGYALALEKMPIVVADGPGFLVNRLLVPYLNEALEMLLEGASIDRIERAATGFGMALGPLRILDEIGLDTTFRAGRVLWEAFPDRVVASPLLVMLIKKGRLGRKTGAGFFTYTGETSWEGPGEDDPIVAALLADWQRASRNFSADEIVDRLLLPMVAEAGRLLEEGKVADPRAIDLAVLFGLGFPAARGGLLYWADRLGAAEICRRLEALTPQGERFRPTPLLADLARRGAGFYGY